MKYLLTYSVFEGLFWNTKVETYNSLETLQDKLNDHLRVKEVRIFEINKEIRIKYSVEDLNNE